MDKDFFEEDEPVEKITAAFDHARRPEVRLELRVLDGDRVEIWTRGGMPMSSLVELLRRMADEFETGDVKRVQ